MLEVNDAIRSTLKTQPKVDTIEQAARKSGKASIAQQTYKLVLQGITSLAEAQRMLKAEK
jgi:type II secretory ATPase GspE/PulE/Tfp pilus assembly ATPase PilB-like protein